MCILCVVCETCFSKVEEANCQRRKQAEHSRTRGARRWPAEGACAHHAALRHLVAEAALLQLLPAEPQRGQHGVPVARLGRRRGRAAAFDVGCEEAHGQHKLAAHGGDEPHETGVVEGEWGSGYQGD